MARRAGVFKMKAVSSGLIAEHHWGKHHFIDPGSRSDDGFAGQWFPVIPGLTL